MGKDHISVVQASDINVFFNITIFVVNDGHAWFDLLVKGFYPWRKKTAEFKFNFFLDAEGCAFADIIEAKDIKTP